MIIGRTFYRCRCGGEILEEWDKFKVYTSCDNCNIPIPDIISPNLFIVGKAGSGKNFIVDIIKEMYPEYQTITIAKPLYDVADMIKVKDTHSIELLLKDMGFCQDTVSLMLEDILTLASFNFTVGEKPRFLLQSLGDILRKYDKKALINHAIKKSLDSPTIIEDVRLKLEAETLLSDEFLYFLDVKIHADKDVRIKRLRERDLSIDEDCLTHKTESEVSEITCRFNIDNSFASREELAAQIEGILGTKRIIGG